MPCSSGSLTTRTSQEQLGRQSLKDFSKSVEDSSLATSVLPAVGSGSPDSPSPRSMTAQAQRVYGLIVKILRNREAAEEVTLGIYVQVWRQRDG